MKRTIDEAGVAHNQASDASALLRHAQREISKRRNDLRRARGNAVDDGGTQGEVGPSVLKGGGIFEKIVRLDRFGVAIDARNAYGTVAPDSVSFGQAKVEQRRGLRGTARKRGEDDDDSQPNGERCVRHHWQLR